MELKSAFETRNWILDQAMCKDRLGFLGDEVYDACKEADLILTNLKEAKLIAGMEVLIFSNSLNFIFGNDTAVFPDRGGQLY
jgi:hypothetical protein